MFDKSMEEQGVDKTTTVTTMKTTEKILEMIKKNPHATAKELAEALTLSIDGVRWHLNKLKKQGKLRRIGPDKGGHWEVIGEKE